MAKKKDNILNNRYECFRKECFGKQLLIFLEKATHPDFKLTVFCLHLKKAMTQFAKLRSPVGKDFSLLDTKLKYNLWVRQTMRPLESWKKWHMAHTFPQATENSKSQALVSLEIFLNVLASVTSSLLSKSSAFPRKKWLCIHPLV